MKPLRIITVGALLAMMLAACGGSQPARSTTHPQHQQRQQHPPAVTPVSGYAAIRTALETRLGADTGLSFNLNHHLTQQDKTTDYSDCYAKLGASAQHLESMSSNILRHDGNIVFVQASQTVPLTKCVTAVRTVLDWKATPTLSTSENTKWKPTHCPDGSLTNSSCAYAKHIAIVLAHVHGHPLNVTVKPGHDAQAICGRLPKYWQCFGTVNTTVQVRVPIS